MDVPAKLIAIPNNKRVGPFPHMALKVCHVLYNGILSLFLKCTCSKSVVLLEFFAFNFPSLTVLF